MSPQAFYESFDAKSHPLVPLKEVALLLGVSYSHAATLARTQGYLVEGGRLPVIRIGRRLFVKRVDLDSFFFTPESGAA